MLRGRGWDNVILTKLDKQHIKTPIGISIKDISLCIIIIIGSNFIYVDNKNIIIRIVGLEHMFMDAKPKFYKHCRFSKSHLVGNSLTDIVL